MARGTQQEKAFRKELSQHLFRMHSFMQTPETPSLTVQELDELHRMMHTDGYACPPHDHPDAEGYVLGKPRLTLGDDYISEVISALKGEM